MKNITTNLLLFLVLIISIVSCKKESSTLPTLPNDLPTEVVKTIKIGDQSWTVTNLDVDTFRNGDKIKKASFLGEWKASKEPMWCYYDFNDSNAKYGKIYNWYTIKDERLIAPNGYHLPVKDEWEKLINFLNDGQDTLAAKKMKSKNVWSDNSTNESGFSALPGGLITYDMIQFGAQSAWWAANGNETKSVLLRLLSGYPRVELTPIKELQYAGYGAYVRCIKD